jgi:hypothetical protein
VSGAGSPSSSDSESETDDESSSSSASPATLKSSLKVIKQMRLVKPKASAAYFATKHGSSSDSSGKSSKDKKARKSSSGSSSSGNTSSTGTSGETSSSSKPITSIAATIQKPSSKVPVRSYNNTTTVSTGLVCARFVEELQAEGLDWGDECRCTHKVDVHQRRPFNANVQSSSGNKNLVKDTKAYPRYGETADIKEKIYDVPVEFLTQFDIVASVAHLSDEDRIKMLIMQIDNNNEKAWAQEKFGKKKRTWERVKQLFIKKFTPVSQRQQAVNKIRSMKEDKDENMKRFISRYNQKLALAGRDTNSTDERDNQDFEAALQKDIHEELIGLKRNKGM